MKHRLLIPALIFSLSLSAQADQPESKVLLARAADMIESAQQLVARAQQQDRHLHAQNRFHYDWLMTDLKSIRSGIQNYLNQRQVNPRGIQQLHTSYSKHQE